MTGTGQGEGEAIQTTSTWRKDNVTLAKTNVECSLVPGRLFILWNRTLLLLISSACWLEFLAVLLLIKRKIVGIYESGWDWLYNSKQFLNQIHSSLVLAEVFNEFCFALLSHLGLFAVQVWFLLDLSWGMEETQLLYWRILSLHALRGHPTGGGTVQGDDCWGTHA